MIPPAMEVPARISQSIRRTRHLDMFSLLYSYPLFRDQILIIMNGRESSILYSRICSISSSPSHLIRITRRRCAPKTSPITLNNLHSTALF